MDIIRIRGARSHNLKNVDVDLPKNKLIAISGVSGSGKSSLAFDTLFAEGQRRYVESLSVYARQFLQQMEKPDIDLIEGLQPAIAIQQSSFSHNPRSTVGTITELHDYLRLLYASIGKIHCPDHGPMTEAQTITEMIDSILEWDNESNILIATHLGSFDHQEAQKVLNNLLAEGFLRTRINEKIVEIDSINIGNEKEPLSIDVIVDRLKVKRENRQRLAESLEIALKKGFGRAIVINTNKKETQTFSNKFSCLSCDYLPPDLIPKIFSFNSPAGACKNCNGLGYVETIMPKSVVTIPELSLAAGAIKGWDRRNQFYFEMLCSLAQHYNFKPDEPFYKLASNIQNIVLYGSGDDVITFSHIGKNGKKVTQKHSFEGIIPNLERRLLETNSTVVKEELRKFLSQQTCPVCKGSRLRKEATHVTIDHRSINEICNTPLYELLIYFRKIELEKSKKEIAKHIFKTIVSRLDFLNNVGLGYLSLDRATSTLSGGEAQRIKLASQIGSGLSGVMYVLDEPSIGLHANDNQRLLKTLENLRDLGNTIIVVEHDMETISKANYVLDMGPGAGDNGGSIIAIGKPEEIKKQENSITGQYLAKRKQIQLPRNRRTMDRKKIIKINGAQGNNLKNITVDIPLTLFTCVTGVSGSGKSTLINGTLYRSVAQHLGLSGATPAPHSKIEGLNSVDKIVDINQKPIGRTPRSNPATYTGIFGPIRDLFANIPLSRERGYASSRFSFNVSGGRCETCKGAGLIKVEMHFLTDMYVTCESCSGKRFNQETLEIKYRDKTIFDVLDMTTNEAYRFFAAIPTLHKKLHTLMEVGLGYMKLGQAAPTLSGGEAQRVKLALEFSKRDTSKTLYILDEPTTGLHLEDVDLLVKILNKLCERGNTVVVIEHNLEVIKVADWVIDLGPGGGGTGGNVVVAGTPEKIANNRDSLTGRHLANVINSFDES